MRITLEHLSKVKVWLFSFFTQQKKIVARLLILTAKTMRQIY